MRISKGNRYAQRILAAVSLYLPQIPHFYFFFSFLCRVIQSIWNVGHSLIFCVSLNYMDDDECGASVEWLARETEVLGGNMPQCHFVPTNPTWPDLAAGGSQLLAWLCHGQMPHYLAWDQTGTSADLRRGTRSSAAISEAAEIKILRKLFRPEEEEMAKIAQWASQFTLLAESHYGEGALSWSEHVTHMADTKRCAEQF
jgi:hypothetical protein